MFIRTRSAVGPDAKVSIAEKDIHPRASIASNILQDTRVAFLAISMTSLMPNLVTTDSSHHLFKHHVVIVDVSRVKPPRSRQRSPAHPPLQPDEMLTVGPAQDHVHLALE